MNEHSISINDEVLSELKSSRFYKRIKNELNALYKAYDQVSVNVNHLGEAVITIYSIVDNKFYKYEFIIGR